MFKPTGNKIILEPITVTEELETKGGLILEASKETQIKSVLSGTVVSIGKDVLEVSEGDTVYYELHAEHRFDVKGVEMIAVQESSIIGFERS